MKVVNLSCGSWKLIMAEPQLELAENLVIPNFDSDEVILIDVPGDVNAALVKNGKMPDPHFDTQGKSCYWVSSKEWWYKLEFDISSATDLSASLLMTGVDGHTDIWLNDSYIGSTKNAFRKHEFQVGHAIKETGNSLIVRFMSIDDLLDGPRLDELNGWNSRKVFLRKPQYNFGWDWALPIPSIGLSGNVWIELDRECRLLDLSIKPFTNGRVDFNFEVSRESKKQGYEINLQLAGHGFQYHQVVKRDTHRSYTSVFIENPKLWYPNGQGDQNLYDYQVNLIVNGKIVDSRQGKMGLREVRIVENPFTVDAGPGMSFWLEINGTPVFSKGSNWAPLDLWPGNVKPSDYEFYLRKMKEANFNMVRIWGGGMTEPDRFYELCNELGLMVWQDFMFASLTYPVDILREEIIAEANDQIRRLRNHPCIVLWCGCNEDFHSWGYMNEMDELNKRVMENNLGGQSDAVHFDEYADKWKVDPYKSDPQIYSMILRGLTDKLGLDVPYIESSPESRDDYGNMPNSGNCHISAWKFAFFDSNNKHDIHMEPVDFRKHFEQVCSFDSEFCIQGPAAISTIKAFLAPENHWPPNDAWLYHIQSAWTYPHHYMTMFIAGGLFGEIDSLEKYVKHGQATHLEMMRSEFESARRDYPNNGGTMMWSFNDCWPTSNWSIIDYYKRPKPAYYAAKRACTPLLPIIFERLGNIEFLFSNHTSEKITAKLNYGYETMDGKTIWKREAEIQIDAGASNIFDKIKRTDIDKEASGYLFMDAIVDSVSLDRIIYFPNIWKEIQWPNPHLNVSIINQEQLKNLWKTRIQIKTDKFVRLCHITLNNEDNRVLFSDNYFDLSQDTQKYVDIESDERLDICDMKVGHWLTNWE